MQPIKGEPTNPIVDVCCCKYFLPTLNPLVILNQCVISIPTQPSVGYRSCSIILLTHSFVVHFWWTDLGGGSHQQITHELSSFKGDWLLTRAIPFRFCICFCFCLRIYLFSKRSSFGWWWVGGILRCHDIGSGTGKFTGHEIEWRGKMIDKGSYELDRLVLLFSSDVKASVLSSVTTIRVEFGTELIGSRLFLCTWMVKLWETLVVGGFLLRRVWCVYNRSHVSRVGKYCNFMDILNWNILLL